MYALPRLDDDDAYWTSVLNGTVERNFPKTTNRGPSPPRSQWRSSSNQTPPDKLKNTMALLRSFDPVALAALGHLASPTSDTKAAVKAFRAALTGYTPSRAARNPASPTPALTAAALGGIGTDASGTPTPTVPALFWSDADAFMRAAARLAATNAPDTSLPALLARTAALRGTLADEGAFVGWLPFNHGCTGAAAAANDARAHTRRATLPRAYTGYLRVLPQTAAFWHAGAGWKDSVLRWDPEAHRALTPLRVRAAAKDAMGAMYQAGGWYVVSEPTGFTDDEADEGDASETSSNASGRSEYYTPPTSPGCNLLGWPSPNRWSLPVSLPDSPLSAVSELL